MNPATEGTERHEIFATSIRALAIAQARTLALPQYRVWLERDTGRPTRRLLFREGRSLAVCETLAATLNARARGWTARVRPATGGALRTVPEGGRHA